MEFTFKAEVHLRLEHKQSWATSKHVATEFNLIVPKEMDQKAYLKDGVPTAAGTKVLTNVLVQGLIGNMHQGLENGFMSIPDHLKYIISELERGAFEVTKAEKGHFSE